MKNLILSLALVTAITSTAQAADDYKGIYGAMGTTVMLTSFPLIPLFITTDFAVDGEFNSTEGLAKKVVEAQDDLTYFVATEGEYQNARIDNVLKAVRESFRNFNGSDMELAMGLIIPK
jgi:uncharacterized protein (TIGR02448 family)